LTNGVQRPASAPGKQRETATSQSHSRSHSFLVTPSKLAAHRYASADTDTSK
jgi:hypothetical protein